MQLHNEASDEDRKFVEELQAKMLLCLLCSEALPAELDPAKARASATSLFEKRMRAVERCLNNHSAKTGQASFRDLFQQFHKAHPSVHPDGPCADAKAFLKFQSRKARTNPCSFACSSPAGGHGSFLASLIASVKNLLQNHVVIDG